MRTTQRFLLACALAALAFATFIVINQARSYDQAQEEARNHSRVIANALWTFEESSALAYLRLAAESYGYEWIEVKDDLDKVFLRIEGPKPSRTDSLLIAIGLIPRHVISADIRHDNRTIGTIRVLWPSRAVYMYLYVLLCLVLFMGGVWLFLRLLDMNRHLETRVRKRTSELESVLAELRDNEEKYRSLVENIPGSVLHCRNDENWTPLFASDSLCDITGFPPSRFFSGEIAYTRDVVHPNDSLRVRATISDALTRGADFNIEYRIIHADGQLRWVSEKGQGVSWREGRPEYFTSAIFDITPRKLAEQELMRLQNLLQGIINSMPSALVGVDSSGHITQWNLEAERVTGISAAAAHGRPLEEVFPALAPEMENVRTAIKEHRVLTTPRLFRQDRGEVRFDDVTVFPLVASKMEGAVIRVDDVTERVRIDEMMVQTEKMMSVGGLAAGMAHEINNPLGGILQGAQNIVRRLSPELAANAKAAEELGFSMDQMQRYMEQRGILRMLAGIQDSGQRAAKIVSNMLDFSRKSGNSMAPCELNDLVETVLTLAASDYDLKKNYDFKKVRIVRECSDSLPPVTCAHTEIEQVLFNLVKNAAYAMADVPKPGVKPTIVLRTFQAGGYAVLQVEDNGPGMSPETRKRIFEPFFTTKAPGVGTGLGLSVSYFIVTQNHGGQFSVESSPGVGSVFTIRLPLSR
ncbi:PAS domain-containing sensor histidine kinase [Desulfocurvus sp. DL9XJH121]